MLIPGRRIPVLLLLLVLTIRAGQAHAAPAVCTLFSAASSYATAAGPQSVAAPRIHTTFSVHRWRASITGPEAVGDKLRYSFVRAIGTKG